VIVFDRFSFLTTTILKDDAMRSFLVSQCLVAFFLTPLIGSQVLAKGGTSRNEDYYDPEHLNRLPPEIRDTVVRQCSTARAMHPFAQYKDNLQTLVLHYEHFYCNTGGAFCGPAGCLHQVYVSSHGHYKLLRSYYAPSGE
jgi:hypothetical protein